MKRKTKLEEKRSGRGEGGREGQKERKERKEGSKAMHSLVTTTGRWARSGGSNTQNGDWREQNCIIYLKASIRVALKCSHHKKEMVIMGCDRGCELTLRC